MKKASKGMNSFGGFILEYSDVSPLIYFSLSGEITSFQARKGRTRIKTKGRAARPLFILRQPGHLRLDKTRRFPPSSHGWFGFIERAIWLIFYQELSNLSNKKIRVGRGVKEGTRNQRRVKEWRVTLEVSIKIDIFVPPQY
jgi:hypothetical protein